jgi:hypothetical protein
MPCTTATRILVVGHTCSSTTVTLQKLERTGCAFHSVDTIAEAETAMRTTAFDIVLAAETTPDGRGYDLTNCVANHSATLLISIALSEACLWLPVVQHGVRTLGERALNSFTLQSEITALLNEKTTGAAAPFARAVHGFMPESAAHRLMGGLDRRTGPEERRGLSVRSSSGTDRIVLPQIKPGPEGATTQTGSKPGRQGGGNAFAAAHSEMPFRNVRQG